MMQFQTSTKFQVHLLHYTTEISRPKKKNFKGMWNDIKTRLI